MVGNVVDADIHAVCNFGVLFLDTFRAGLDRRIICRDELAVGVHGNTFGSNPKVRDTGEPMSNSLLGLVESFDLATLAANLFQVIEVALAHRCDVTAAEDTDFEVLRLSLAVLTGDLGT